MPPASASGRDVSQHVRIAVPRRQVLLTLASPRRGTRLRWVNGGVVEAPFSPITPGSLAPPRHLNHTTVFWTDACGLAGGNTEHNPTCSYNPSPHAKLGDRGSELPPAALSGGAVWRRGSNASVAWGECGGRSPLTSSLNHTTVAAWRSDPGKSRRRISVPDLPQDQHAR
jgi:hypothetical protein